MDHHLICNLWCQARLSTPFRHHNSYLRRCPKWLADVGLPRHPIGWSPSNPQPVLRPLLTVSSSSWKFPFLLPPSPGENHGHTSYQAVTTAWQEVTPQPWVTLQPCLFWIREPLHCLTKAVAIAKIYVLVLEYHNWQMCGCIPYQWMMYSTDPQNYVLHRKATVLDLVARDSVGRLTPPYNVAFALNYIFLILYPKAQEAREPGQRWDKLAVPPLPSSSSSLSFSVCACVHASVQAACMPVFKELFIIL